MSEIKGIQYLSAIAIVALVLIGLFATSRPFAIQTNRSATTKTIQVNGVGTVTATPDNTLLQLAVMTQSPTATEATQDNAGRMAKVIQALQSLGVGRTSVTTVSYSLTPVYDSSHDQQSPPKVVAYAARNAIRITVENVSMTGTILDAAVTAGANEVNGISFTFAAQTLTSLQKQALQLAIQDASDQAQAMASSLGVRIVGPLTVTTGYYNPPSVERLTVSAQTPVQPGTLQVAATVQVTYEVA
jgi:hypothetical protein